MRVFSAKRALFEARRGENAVKSGALLNRAAVRTGTLLAEVPPGAGATATKIFLEKCRSFLLNSAQNAAFEAYLIIEPGTSFQFFCDFSPARKSMAKLTVTAASSSRQRSSASNRSLCCAAPKPFSGLAQPRNRKTVGARRL